MKLTNRVVNKILIIYIHIIDQIFIYRLNNPIIGKRNLFNFTLSKVSSLKSITTKKINRYLAQKVIKEYSIRNSLHYQPGGRGYRGLAVLNQKMLEKEYQKLTSRLEFIVKNYSRALNIQLNQSWVEFGCGKGQNLKYLINHDPNLTYHGFDINEDCLKVANLGKMSDGITLQVGDIKDIEFLRRFDDNQFDNSLISHVLSTILCETIDETEIIHKSIVSELCRITRNSIIIIDEQNTDNKFSVNIEQLNRATINQDLFKFFKNYDGELFYIKTDVSKALIFRKNRQ